MIFLEEGEIRKIMKLNKFKQNLQSRIFEFSNNTIFCSFIFLFLNVSFESSTRVTRQILEHNMVQ